MRKKRNPTEQYYVLWKNGSSTKIVGVDTIEQAIRFVETVNTKLNHIAIPLFKSDLIKIRSEINALLGR